MTTRDTSRAAYEHLVESGALASKQQRSIMSMLMTHKSGTSGEIIKRISDDNEELPITNINAWRARFTELAGRGLIREIGERRCSVSQRMCIVWSPTDRTKPLDRKRGATTITAAAWRKVAAALVAEVESGGNVGHPDMAAVLERYRKLAGGVR